MSPVTRLSGRALANLLPQLRQAPGPLYTALSQSVTSLLLDGRLAPGTKLPSERELAATLQLSRATVTTAYDQLRAGGLLTSRTGSGSVTALPASASPVAGSRWRLPLPPGRSGATAGRAGPGGLGGPGGPGGPGEAFIDLSCATFPAPEQLQHAIQAAAEQLPAHSAGSGYEPAGIMELREAIAARFGARGVPTRPDQILVTNGALHAIDLVLRLTTSPGERVVTELPTYSGLLDAVRANGARAVAVPMSPRGGWQVAPLTAALQGSGARLAALTPDFHNPTGCLVPDDDRRQVLRAARRSRATVLVDESFVELGFVAGATPMAALDPNVITVGSLSKPIWGGLRVGWVRAPADVIQRLVVVRAAIDMGQSIFDQLTAVALFEKFDAITAQRRAEVLPRRDALLDALASQFPNWRVGRPDGGLSVWVELDVPLATALTMQAAHHGLRIVAGSRFGLDGTMERFLRLPFTVPEDQLRGAVERLARAWCELDGASGGYSPLIVA